MTARKQQQGFSLIEILVTILIISFGLLGATSMQLKVQSLETDSFQRAQAMMLVDDMVSRMNLNRTDVDSYVTGLAVTSILGYGDSQPANCAALNGVLLDQCEWSNALKGAAEMSGASSAATAVGAMVNARGCIEVVTGSTPPTYKVTVVWQGLTALSGPPQACGSGLYGQEEYRRALTKLVTVANLTAP